MMTWGIRSWRFPTSPLESEMVQPSDQFPPLGATVTVVLRVTASLRASTRPENTSKLAVFTPCARMISRKLGVARPIRITSTANVTMVSVIVNPSAVARERTLVIECEHAVRDLRRARDGSRADGVGGRQGGHCRIDRHGIEP